MKFSTILAPVVLSLLPTIASAVTLAYDTTYDNAGGSLTTVACSDGSHGMLTRGFKTFGSLPKFPHIGAASAVTGWNSPNCGTCWQVTYKNGQGVSKSINVLAIDVAGAGFNIALSAMNELTGGNAVMLGRVDVTSKQVAASVCGL
ncbi:cerato-platanin-related secreted protein [Collybia nuda]|uniref:Cerato-platanin-related secreted protein n=1 Tax=Collybia nuda TaxID=64659 RepID=A0A9P5YBG9_9AGAR|nr:cerato-platanin-related secreted protein [Collybia nuda]